MATRARPVEERFWSKVVPTGFCWLWTGAVDRKGYGHGFRLGGQGSRQMSAHRLAYELLVGTIPEGYTIDHLCRVRNCVNPDHLEPVPAWVNTRRSPATFQSKNAAKTHCSNGHEFTPENTYIWPKQPWARHCRECSRIRCRERRQRKRLLRVLDQSFAEAVHLRDALLVIEEDSDE